MQVGNKSLSLSFTIRRRFHIGHSLLARQIRNRVSDEHYAEGIFILALSMLGIGLVVLFYLAWAGLEPLFIANPENTTSLTTSFFLGQVGAGLLFFLICLLGYKPGVDISLSDEQLVIEQGKTVRRIPVRAIRNVSSISALQYHRHYRKYQNTQSFFVRLPAVLLLLTTDTGPVVLGTLPEQQQELVSLLQQRRTQTPIQPPVPVG